MPAIPLISKDCGLLFLHFQSARTYVLKTGVYLCSNCFKMEDRSKLWVWLNDQKWGIMVATP